MASARGAAQQQLATTNAAAAGAGSEATALQNQLAPLYTNELNQGYTPAQQAAMTQAGEGAVASRFGAANQTAENRAAATRNAAGTAAQEDALAREQGPAAGNVAANLQQTFANQQQANQQAGLKGLEQLYGSNVGQEESFYGMAPSTINAWNQANQVALGPLNSAIGAAGTVLGGVAKGKG